MTLDLAAADRAATLRRTKLRFGAKTVYGLGNVVDGLSMMSLNTFQFFYLTAVCGLSNSLAGLAVSLALVVDGIGDPLVGALSDNSSSRIGRRHPFMLAGLAPMALGLGLLFSTPRALTGWSLFAYAFATTVMVRVAHSLFNLPYAALGAELSDDYAERISIVATRIFFTVLSQVGCLILGQGVFMGGAGGLLKRAAYAPFGWTMGALTFAGGLACILGTLNTLGRLHPTSRPEGHLGLKLLRDAAEVIRNPAFLILFLCMVAAFTGLGTAIALTLHMNTYFWALPPNVILAALLAAPAGILLSVFITGPLVERVEKRLVVLIGLGVISAVLLGLPLLKIFGLIPPKGPVLYAILILNGFLISGLIIGAITIAFQAMMADAADAHEYQFGTRQEGLFYAGLNFAVKAAGGLGALIAGVGLDIIHFPVNLAAHPGAAAAIPPETVRNLGLIYGVVGAGMLGLATVIFGFYRLDRGEHQRIQTVLEGRRKAAAEAQAAEAPAV